MLNEEEKKISLGTINLLMIFIFILIITQLILGTCYFGKVISQETILALFFIVFLWLNIIFILFKIEQISLRDRMVAPILMRKLSNIIVLTTITILLIIIMLIVRVFFSKFFI